jgi:excinuclease ABC subunit B
VETLERISILRDLRLGVFDVIVGINLLREGLDLPEVSLVAILDADKEGFLRSGTALIQTIGRAARNLQGRVIMYADRMTDSMKYALDETNRRRAKQVKYNQDHGIVPVSIHKAIRDITDSLSAEGREKALGIGESKAEYRAGKKARAADQGELQRMLVEMERQMKEAAKNLEFERAAALRDEIFELKGILADNEKLTPLERIRLLTREE